MGSFVIIRNISIGDALNGAIEWQIDPISNVW